MSPNNSTPNVHPVIIDGKIGFINRNGDIVVQPIYDSVSYYFFAGFWYVEKDGLHGCVDADVLQGGVAQVRLKGEYVYIDQTGRKVWPKAK